MRTKIYHIAEQFQSPIESP